MGLKNIGLIVVLMAAFFGSCNEPEKNAVEKTEISRPEVEKLPPITTKWAQRLFEEVDFLDVNFYNTNFSLSIDQKPSIQQFISTISSQKVDQVPDCPSQGKIFYQSQGKEIMNADVHFIPGKCAYLVFSLGPKKMFANPLSEQGVSLFTQYLNPQLLKQQNQSN